MSLRFCMAVFLGSALLFLVEPMCAKMALPMLGGTPAVWNTCMVFFQTGLLAGYACAHYLPDRMGLGRHAILHMAVLALAAWTLPVALPESLPAGWHPVLGLLLALSWAVGLPFVLVSTTTPLLHRWFALGQGTSARDPYFLYAASNLGSFAGLLSYPLLVEPAFSLAEQAWLWLAGYLLLVVVTAACFPWGARRTAPASPASVTPAAEPESASGIWLRRLRWTMLAAVPSCLMLSVTTYLTTDIAPIPLLWVIPLSLYLLTYVLAFAGRPIVPLVVLMRWAPLAVLVAVVVLLLEASDPLPVVLAVHLLVLFWLALACHGTLAAERPPVQRLTEFYLCLAVGGALGGAFNGLLAPLVFSRLTEYPLMLVLAALLCGLHQRSRPGRADFAWAAGIGAGTAVLVLVVQHTRLLPIAAGQMSVAAIFAVPLVLAYAGHERPWRFALGLAGVLLAGSFYHGIHGTPVYRERSYFGVHLVADRDGMRRLVHGGTVHGMESLRPGERGMPLTYYHRTGPIGQVMRALAGDPRLDRVGFVGLGAGSVAYYSRPGQRWSFYEIDPSVIRIARDPRLFTFLRDARGTIDVVEGDGRLQLAASDATFGLLVLDAFGSDAIPLHLLTREAMQIYRQRVEPHGIVAFHVSNNYLDLEPVLANLARDADPPWRCRVRIDQVLTDQDREAGKFPSVWIVLASRDEDLPAALRSFPWRRASPRDELPVWTDSWSNVWQVFRTAGSEGR